MPPDAVDPSGEIRTSLAAEPDTIDPQRESFPDEIAQTLMVYEPLLTFDPKTLQPVPAAARALPDVSDDGLTLTFTLRDGLSYSDGAPLRAQDFVNGWTRLCDPSIAGDFAFVGYVISGCERWNNLDPKRATAFELAAARADLGVRALDDRRILFTLTRPAPYFLAIAALWVGAPVRASDVSTGGDRWTDPRTFVGNGPFRLTEWTHGERLVFERNDRYRTPAKLKRWTKVIVTDPAASKAAFANGELDVISAGKDDPGAVSAPPSATFYIGLNVQRPPFDDQKVRLALARSLDRAAYVRDVLDQPAVPATSLVPAGLPGSDPSDDAQAFDPAAARALLAASRYQSPLPPMEFSYRTNAPRSIAQAKWAIAQWQTNLGVTVVEHPIGDCGFCQLVKKPEEAPQIFPLGWSLDYPDPQDWLPTIFRSNAAVQHTGYRSDTFDGLVDRADVERDPVKRLDLYRQAQRLLTSDAPAIFLYSTERRYLINPRVRGYALTGSDWEFAQFAIASMYVAKH
ncbi:MAG TPA: peptide ABC transporter substrate-binding protein [Candidatus Saccharimonadales bacterium]|nr:peptide ABC transporter substrate-binding protein [Candidatus Saccharimonadales bacterium]